MLESIPIMIGIGTILGFLAGIGVGGGSLLILWLTFVLNMEHSIARNINLLFFIPSAAIASIFRWKQGTLDIRQILPAILGGCISAACFSFMSSRLDVSVIKRLFGFLLLATGIRELLYKSKK